jgi:C1A family cysteine protease
MKVNSLILGALLLTTTAITIYTLFKNSNTNQTNSSDMASFLSFKKRYSKIHESDSELEYRFKIYQSNMNYAREMNAKNLSYTLGENKFADLTFEEFKSGYLMTPIPNEIKSGEKVDFEREIDWRNENVITPVKDQGACGSCWAFSTTGAFEAALQIQHKTEHLVSLSEQELVDCSRSYGNFGCNGGLMSFAFNYIKDHKLSLGKDYPYKGRDQKCTANQSKERYTVAGQRTLATISVEGLVEELKNTPVSVAIEVQYSFQLYTGGVYVGEEGCGSGLNHGVLLVGLVKEDDNNWDFVVKNSWGQGWGEKGFIRMRTGTGSGVCGIANDWDAVPLF